MVNCPFIAVYHDRMYSDRTEGKGSRRKTDLLRHGCTDWISEYFFNIFDATGLMPNTGIPLPFVSYGLDFFAFFVFGNGVCIKC